MLRIIREGEFDHSGPHESAVYFKQGNSYVAVGGEGGEEEPVQNSNLI